MICQITPADVLMYWAFAWAVVQASMSGQAVFTILIAWSRSIPRPSCRTRSFNDGMLSSGVT